VQETRNRYTDPRQDLRRFLVDPQRFLANVEGAHCQYAVDIQTEEIYETGFAFEFVHLFDEVFAIDEPDFAHDNQSVGCKHDAESGNGRREVWRQQRLHCPHWLLKVKQQRQCRYR
jgi:hypothetical protein